MKLLKTAMYLVGGILWILFGGGFATVLWQFLTHGAGLQLFGDFIPAISSGSVLFGLVYFIGLSAASLICFALGINLFTRGISTGK
ncbi:MAG TPA: hypothetical protein VN516_03795 [Candidatus Baltobacteraceae bacterium]|nr:hypothetical protein [Candidatus Baltobacteraceae bacterium]